MTVDIWGFESKLYPLIDAKGLEGQSNLKEEFCLGENVYVNVKINNFDKVPLDNHGLISQSGTVFSANFRRGKDPWFRVDNESQDCIHFHLQSGARLFEKHIPINQPFTTSELISYAFEKAREIIPWKFPETNIKDTDGFIGSL
jgi:hypothetical protein